MLIDTHQVVEDIIKSGLKKKQAEIITRAINQSNNNLVTKADLRASVVELRSEIHEIKSDVNAIKSTTDTTKWMIGLSFALNLTIMGLVLSLKFQ